MSTKHVQPGPAPLVYIDRRIQVFRALQTAVDAKNHLIVAHEVSNVDTDRDQLASMSKLARSALETKQLTVIADRGYFKGEGIFACENEGITVFVPKPTTSNAKADGRFDKADFIYGAQRDEQIRNLPIRST